MRVLAGDVQSLAICRWQESRNFPNRQSGGMGGCGVSGDRGVRAGQQCKRNVGVVLQCLDAAAQRQHITVAEFPVAGTALQCFGHSEWRALEEFRQPVKGRHVSIMAISSAARRGYPQPAALRNLCCSCWTENAIFGAIPSNNCSTDFFWGGPTRRRDGHAPSGWPRWSSPGTGRLTRQHLGRQHLGRRPRHFCRRAWNRRDRRRGSGAP